jgi:hypothetical protein
MARERRKFLVVTLRAYLSYSFGSTHSYIENWYDMVQNDLLPISSLCTIDIVRTSTKAIVRIAHYFKPVLSTWAIVNSIIH